MSRRTFARGTYLENLGPWETYSGGRALCADGVVRNLQRIAPSADTFFSIPAAIQVKGKKVSGYVTVTTMSGSDVVTDDDPAVVVFRAVKYGKNYSILPNVERIGQ